MNGFQIDKHGSTYIAHRQGCDCLADEDGRFHAEADHPTSALRALLKKINF